MVEIQATRIRSRKTEIRILQTETFIILYIIGPFHFESPWTVWTEHGRYLYSNDFIIDAKEEFNDPW